MVEKCDEPGDTVNGSQDTSSMLENPSCDDIQKSVELHEPSDLQ